MSIASTLFGRRGNAEEYVCGFCGQRYDRDRLTCLACGLDVVSPTDR